MTIMFQKFEHYMTVEACLAGKGITVAGGGLPYFHMNGMV